MSFDEDQGVNDDAHIDQPNTFTARAKKQFTVTGRVKPTRAPGGEAIRFSFRMGAIRFTCIANIPGEDEDKAPVYVHVEVVP